MKKFQLDKFERHKFSSKVHQNKFFIINTKLKHETQQNLILL